MVIVCSTAALLFAWRSVESPWLWLWAEQLAKAESERTELTEQVKKLTAEVEDVKTAAAIQEVGKEDEIAKAHRQHEEELASFQQIMEGNLCLVKLEVMGKS